MMSLLSVAATAVRKSAATILVILMLSVAAGLPAVIGSRRKVD